MSLLRSRASPPTRRVEPPRSPTKRRADLAVEALPLAFVLGVAAVLVLKEGGFSEGTWYPAGLILLALVATVAIAAGPRLARGPRDGLFAAVGLGGFTAWCFASIAWAAVPGDAWTGANRALLYLVVFALLAVWPVSSRVAWPVLLATGGVVAIEGVLTVERLAHASDPSSFLIGTRLSEPLGYPNATAALFMTAAWLMVGLASRQWIPAPARALAFGLAGLNVVLSLLAESRGSIFTLPLVAAVFLALVPGRLRLLATLVPVLAAVAAVLGPITDVWDASLTDVVPRMQSALDAGLVASLVLALVGFLYARVDLRLRLSARTVWRLGIAVVAAAAIAAGVGATVGRPWAHMQSAWHSFRFGGEPSGTARFGGLGSNRYDFWRVGLIEFERHPVAGIGADNFLVPYVQLRRSDEAPAYPHSLWVDLLSQTGLVGTALFLGFIALTLRTVGRIASRKRRELARILVAGASVWLLHGLVDWLWEMPVLGLVGMALLGTACGLAPREKTPRRAAAALPRPARRRHGWLLAGVGGPLVAGVGGTVLLLVAAASFALPWLAQHQIDQAAGSWQHDPAGAFTTLDGAGSLNPLSDEADLIAGAIASRLHRYELMRARYADAVGRSPDDWYAQLELGIAASLTGRHALAASSLARAAELDPREPIVGRVLRTFAAGRKLDSDAIDRAFAAQS